MRAKITDFPVNSGENGNFMVETGFARLHPPPPGLRTQAPFVLSQDAREHRNAASAGCFDFGTNCTSLAVPPKFTIVGMGHDRSYSWGVIALGLAPAVLAAIVLFM